MDGGGRVNTGVSVEQAVAAGGTRARKRDSLFLSATVQFAGEEHTREVRVRNLSAGGLMIELNRIVEPGVELTLAMRGLGEITGRVAWCAHGRLGVALDEPIDPKRARTPVGVGTTTPEYAKPLIARAPRKR